MFFRSIEELMYFLSSYDISLGFGCVSVGDEKGLLPEEVESFMNCTVSVKRQGAAARGLARTLLVQRGYDPFPLPRRLGFGPVWPPRIVGSLAHCEDCAAAAIASASCVSGLGIDIEPALPIADDVFEFIATARERRSFSRRGVWRRVLFCAKEAAFKAAYAADQIPVEFHEIEIGDGFDMAVTRYGRQIFLNIAIESHIRAVGFIPGN